MPLNILNVVQLACERIQDINNDNLPVGLTLVQKRHNTENLDLLDLTNETNVLANLTDVKWIVVAPRLGLGVSLGGIFPCLSTHTRETRTSNAMHNAPAGMRHSSRCSHGGGNSCGRNGACPS